MDELIGFVSSNSNRQTILELLGHKGALDIKMISKFAHIPEKVTKNILNELKDKGLISLDHNKYSLTDTGLEVENRVRRLR